MTTMRSEITSDGKVPGAEADVDLPRRPPSHQDSLIADAPPTTRPSPQPTADQSLHEDWQDCDSAVESLLQSRNGNADGIGRHRCSPEPSHPAQTHHRPIGRMLADVNAELWIVLSLLLLAALVNYLVAGQRLVLGFYTLPTLISAYVYGRRHATMTAIGSGLLVLLIALLRPEIFGMAPGPWASESWHDLAAWGGMLMVTAYAMGTLHERHKTKVLELQQTYHGLLHLLRHFISHDRYTENHCWRVSIYATRIAAYLDFNQQKMEDLRAAALLHDIGKLEVSRELLHKAAQLSWKEYQDLQQHVEYGATLLEPVSGPLHRIIPIVLAHHERYDGSGRGGLIGEQIPLGARVVAVADVYDALTSDRPYRRAITPYEAKETIIKGAGREFDPQVVRAFQEAFHSGELEVPEICV
jgi:putative nucleotidyltransferase with HDIG domain